MNGRLRTWPATAMIVSEVVGVGIFLTPAAMMRTLGSAGAALFVWFAMAIFSGAGALCCAELATRFPRAGGPYVYLREAYGPRTAFVYGWMSLLVVDPGLTAALAIGFAQYLLVSLGATPRFLPLVAVAAIVAFGGLTLIGIDASARVMRWSATAKLITIAVLVIAAATRAGAARVATDAATTGAATSPGAVAGAIVAAFFAFGGWWDLGKIAGEVDAPRRTFPRALIGGVLLVAAIYALVSVSFILVTAGRLPETDEALVSTVGAALFGDAAARLLATMVVLAVAGSLAAVLFGAPRVYLAMARDHLFPPRLAHVDERRGASAGATLVQVVLACAFVLMGTFDQILGYFVPAAVFFLGLSTSALAVLPRVPTDRSVFQAPAYPAPLVLFLVLIVVMLVLFAAGQPRQTLLGALVVAAGIPVSRRLVPRRDGV